MSLKYFHICFIILSMICGGVVSYWSFYISNNESFGIKILGISSLISMVIMLIYGIWFYYKKIKYLKI